MKKVFKYILKQKNGINLIIASKMQCNEKAPSGNYYFFFYDRIKMSLRYKRTPEDIYNDLLWSINNIKDFAQYQTGLTHIN